MQSASPSSKSLDAPQRPLSLPSHLYNRAGIFYFRLVLTEKLRQRLGGGVEIRLSLRTAYRRKALDLSRRLYTHFYEIAENDPMISYKEIRRRLNIYLQRQLEMDHNNVFSRPAVKDYFVLATDHPDYSETDIYRHHAEALQEAVNNPEALKVWAEVAIEELTRCGLLLSGDIKHDHRLQLAKTFLESLHV